MATNLRNQRGFGAAGIPALIEECVDGVVDLLFQSPQLADHTKFVAIQILTAREDRMIEQPTSGANTDIERPAIGPTQYIDVMTTATRFDVSKNLALSHASNPAGR